MLQTNVPQFAPDPIVIDQSATEDNLVVLMAAASEHDSDLKVVRPGPSAYPKHFGLNNWSRRSDCLKWNIALATGGVYHVYAKLGVARDARGIYLSEVPSNSAAYAAVLRAGDFITQINDCEASGLKGFLAAVSGGAAGQKTKLELLRNQRSIVVEVETAQREKGDGTEGNE